MIMIANKIWKQSFALLLLCTHSNKIASLVGYKVNISFQIASALILTNVIVVSLKEHKHYFMA